MKMSVHLHNCPEFQSADYGYKDVVSVFILREDVNKCLLKKVDGRGWWLPFTALQLPQKSWDSAVLTLLQELIGALDEDLNKWQLINLSRVFHDYKTNTSDIAIFTYKIPTITNDIKLNNSNCRWASIKDLSRGHQSIDLIGSEPLEIFNHAIAGHKHLIYKEMSFKTEELKQQNSLLFRLAKYTDNDLRDYIHTFAEATFPTTRMNETTFRSVMESLGWSPRLIPPLFRAFNSLKSGYVDYSEFLCGLALMEKHTVHGEARCRFVFRFYDSDSDDLMTFADFRSMISDVSDLKPCEDMETDSQVTSEDTYVKLFDISSTSESLSIKKFLETIGALKFRGTSTLLRLNKPLNKLLKLSNKTVEVGDQNEVRPSKRARINDDLLNYSEASTSNYEPVKCPNYELATHTVKLKYSGQLLDIQPIWDLEGTPAVNSDISFNELAKISRLDSVNYFNKMSPQSRILVALNQWASDSKRIPDCKWNGWGCMSPGDIVKCLLTVCQEAASIMSNESRLLKVASPIYIFGDLHGSYTDLIYFEKAFWRFGTYLTPAKLLFLGDYVDRGDFGLEVVAHLLSHKVLAPNNVFLLRGNHEVRNIQKENTFYDECTSRFGIKVGLKVWEAINQCFDAMPFAAVVDHKVFCVHGGIFSPQYGNGFIDVIQQIPVPLSDPHTSPIAWEMIWNDPTDGTCPAEESDDGFYPNLKRNTAKCFTTAALERFLNRNNLSHVIRAHQVKQAGFQLQQHGKLVTVYSSSAYLGRANEIACVLADKAKLRILVIDTT